MFLRAVVYSKVTEVKLMLYDSDPNNARMIMKYNTFHSMNPIYGREREFSKSTLYYHAMHHFLSNVNANNLLSNENSLWCLFQMLQQFLKFDFSMFSKDKNNFLKEKTLCSLFKKDPHYANESTKNQINEQANNPIYSFNESKNKEQTNVVFSNVRENDLSNHK